MNCFEIDPAPMNPMFNEPKRGFSFLFRTDEGIIGRAGWWRGLAAIAAPLLILTLGWRALAPFAHRDLSQRAFIDPMTITAYVYLLFYTFAVILAAICFYNLSAKRFRDRGRAAACAGLLPFSVFVAGAAHWLQPRSEGSVPAIVPLAFDVIAAAIAIWTLIDLGVFSSGDSSS